MALELMWTTSPDGVFARFNIPDGKKNLASLNWVDVRVANDPDNDGALLELAVLDKNGKKPLFSPL